MYRIWLAERNWLHSYLSERYRALGSAIDNEKDFKSLRIGGEDMIVRSKDEPGKVRIPITGPLSKEGPGIIDLILGVGGTSFLDIQEALQIAEDDESVREVVLDINSPGGRVLGVEETARQIAEMETPVEAVNQGVMASAAYWLASQADKITSTADTNMVGSIGVIVETFDVSKALEDMGIEQVVITSENAPDKFADVSTEQGRNLIQDQVNAIERTMIGNIAKGRGIDKQNVIDNFGQGRVMVSRDEDKKKPSGLKNGLIDGMLFDSIAVEARGPHDDKDNDGDDKPDDDETEATGMTLKEWIAKHPELGALIEEAKHDAKEEGRKEGRAEGREAYQKELEGRVDKARNVLTSDAYGDSVKNVACEVITGKKDAAVLDSVVTVIDQQKEQEKARKGAEETDASGESQPTSEKPNDNLTQTGVAKDASDYEALMNKVGGSQ